MISSLILAAVLQLPAPKMSMLGEDKTWWTKLKRGDTAVLHATPDTGIPLVKLRCYSISRAHPGLVEESDLNYLSFESAIEDTGKADRTESLDFVHSMYDQETIAEVQDEAKVKIVAIHERWRDRPGGFKLSVPMAEVVLMKGSFQYYIEELNRIYWIYGVPVAYMRKPDQLDRRLLDKLPLLVPKSSPEPRASCLGKTHYCRGGDVITYAEAQQRWQERQRQLEQIRQAGIAEAARLSGKPSHPVIGPARSVPQAGSVGRP
jgi:hypothetical protein